MKKIKFLILLIIVMQFSCQQEKEVKSCCKKDAHETTASTSAPSDESIYNLESKWVTQTGDSIELNTFSGKAVITAMVFTHCESACPRIVADIQRIEKALTKDGLSKLTFLLISMDPERDTPARFNEFAKEHQLGADWVMISSTQDATMEMANILNVRIKKLSEGGFDHSNTIHLLDKNGNIVFQQNGLAQEPDEMIKNIKQQLEQ